MICIYKLRQPFANDKNTLKTMENYKTDIKLLNDM